MSIHFDVAKKLSDTTSKLENLEASFDRQLDKAIKADRLKFIEAELAAEAAETSFLAKQSEFLQSFEDINKENVLLKAKITQLEEQIVASELEGTSQITEIENSNKNLKTQVNNLNTYKKKVEQELQDTKEKLAIIKRESACVPPPKRKEFKEAQQQTDPVIEILSDLDDSQENQIFAELDANELTIADDLANMTTQALATPQPSFVNMDFVSQMGDLLSREDKKSIPTFNGGTEDLHVSEWVWSAERISRSNNWSDQQKIKHFSDRLRGEAMDWHLDYLDNNPEISYNKWRTDLIERFSDETNRERIRTALAQLKQGSDQRARGYIARLDNTAIRGIIREIQ